MTIRTKLRDIRDVLADAIKALPFITNHPPAQPLRCSGPHSWEPSRAEDAEDRAKAVPEGRPMPPPRPMQELIQAAREAMNLYYQDLAQYPAAPMLREGCRSWVPTRKVWAEMHQAAEARVRAWGRLPGRTLEITQVGQLHIIRMAYLDDSTSAAESRLDHSFYEANLALYRKGWHLDIPTTP